MTPDVTVLGKMASILSAITNTQSQPEIGSLEVALCGYGPQVPRVQGEAVFSRATVIDVVNPITDPAAGTFEFALYSNTTIQPEGTYYTFTVKDDNGDIIQIQAYSFGPGEFHFDALTPFDPNFPPPGLPYPIQNQLLIVAYTATPEFPGDTFTTWQITLAGDATATFTDLVDGNLYTIVIIQDANGNHTFGWPGNVYNTPAIHADPNAMTAQTFVAVSQELYPIGGATYYP